MHFTVGQHSIDCYTACPVHHQRRKNCKSCAYCSCFVQVKDAILNRAKTFDQIRTMSLMPRITLNSVLNEMTDMGFLSTYYDIGDDGMTVKYALAGTLSPQSFM